MAPKYDFSDKNDRRRRRRRSRSPSPENAPPHPLDVHPAEWSPSTHHGQCGMNCPCCRALRGEVFGACRVCQIFPPEEPTDETMSTDSDNQALRNLGRLAATATTASDHSAGSGLLEEQLAATARTASNHNARLARLVANLDRQATETRTAAQTLEQSRTADSHNSSSLHPWWKSLDKVADNLLAAHSRGAFFPLMIVARRLCPILPAWRMRLRIGMLTTQGTALASWKAGSKAGKKPLN